MRGERLEVVTAEVAAAARVMALLGPSLDLSGRSVSGVSGAASETEAAGALEGFCRRFVAVAGQMADDADALATATARAAECYQLADQYAMPDPGPTVGPSVGTGPSTRAGPSAGAGG